MALAELHFLIWKEKSSEWGRLLKLDTQENMLQRYIQSQKIYLVLYLIKPLL